MNNTAGFERATGRKGGPWQLGWIDFSRYQEDQGRSDEGWIGRDRFA